MRHYTTAEAKAIIQEITYKHGYLDEDMMNELETKLPETRRIIDHQFSVVRNLAGQSITTLAKRTYESDARFIFELLQNADDNAFDEALRQDTQPYVCFQKHPNHIVVDCNEDGFEKKHIDALCSVGQSTKVTQHGYIGAKGIGFKSVFIVASAVYVQSGAFSFKFLHGREDTGLGMVTPIWAASETLQTLQTPLTRMTLHIHNEGGQDGLEHLRHVITTQLHDLKETCLLFLKNLQRIRIEIYDGSGKLEMSKEFRKFNVDMYRTCLETTSRDATGVETITRMLYHITKHVATNLPLSDNREAPNSDTMAAFTTAEVILAFPLCDDYKPNILYQQEIFAFLPVKTSDYSFIIHSDFDTNINRQDILTTSRRNIQLRKGIVEAFVLAVVQFCQHPTLGFYWPLFLPFRNFPWLDNSFWSVMNQGIVARLKQEAVFVSRARRQFRYLSDVRELPAEAKIGEEPIFDDEASDPFLSSMYPDEVVHCLRLVLGLADMDKSGLFQLVSKDTCSSNSRMRSNQTSNEWHSRAAQLLCWLLNDPDFLPHQLKQLQIIPLRDGRWSAALPKTVYFGTTRGINIPGPLDMLIVDAVAATNIDRRKLFKRLGVTYAAPHHVRNSILAYVKSAASLQVSSSVAFLQYFYIFHQAGDNFNNLIKTMPVITSNALRGYPAISDIYLPGNDDPFGPKALLPSSMIVGNPKFSFLHEEYMATTPERPSADHPSWKQWLYDFAGIRERIRLTSISKDDVTLSPAARYVLYKNPTKFLGLLRHICTREGDYMSPAKIGWAKSKTIEFLEARHLCGANYHILLRDTWLPYERLKIKVEKYMEHPEKFPFLRFEGHETDSSLWMNWGFLNSTFDVGTDDNLKFLLEILKCIIKSTNGPISVKQMQMIFDLYITIEAQCPYDQPREELERVRKAFDAHNMIFIPDCEAPKWVKASNCRWHAPSGMRLSFPLQSLYATILGESQMRPIERLFQDVIGICPVIIDNVINEIEAARQDGGLTGREITNMYRYLDKMELKPEEVRGAFQNKQLIYVGDGSSSAWYKVSECIWSSKTPIHGYVTLEDTYRDLQSFFVDTLGVRSLTLQMVYDELIQTQHEKTLAEVTATLLCFSDFLRTEPTKLEPGPILNANIYPLQNCNGELIMSNSQTDFAIPDQRYLRKKFQNKINLLCFNSEDIRRLQPFFQWSGLDRRYLSSLVQERTSISNESCLPISNKDRDLRRKAYHILRIAATYKSPQYQNDPDLLYQKLQSIRVIVTDGIFCELEVLQNNTAFKVTEPIGSVHINDNASSLNIYVPREKKMQDVCFCSVLPRSFARWLMQAQNDGDMAEADATTHALATVFTASRCALKEILDRIGIENIPIKDQESEEYDFEELKEATDTYEAEDARENEHERSAPELEQENLSNRSLSFSSISSISSISSMQDIPSTNFSIFGSSSVARQRVISSFQEAPSTNNLSTFGSSSVARQRVISSMQETPSTNFSIFGSSSDVRQRATSSVPPQFLFREPSRTFTPLFSSGFRASSLARPSPEDEWYLRILNMVVSAARRASFPSQGPFDMSSMLDALADVGDGSMVSSFDGLDTGPDFRSNTQFERDKKIGAAGELYVFELLSKLGLSGWSRENWQSTIRSCVRMHPEYTTIEDWNQKETADLVYNDTHGHFTRLLADHGHVPEYWRGRRPKYFLEVKTTTGPCGTRFFMSDNQYKLMKKAHHDGNHKNVYLIMRVFWVTGSKVSACIYLDPEQLRKDGGLKFSAKWSVFPGRGWRPEE